MANASQRAHGGSQVEPADRIQGLIDRSDVADLLGSYARSVDTKDWTLFRSTFADDAKVDYTAAYGIAGSPDEITDWISKLMTDEFVPDTMHGLTNVTVAVHGDTAEASAYYINPDVMSDGEGGRYLLFNGGRYFTTCARTPEGWKFTDFRAEIVFSHKGDLMQFEIPDDRA